MNLGFPAQERPAINVQIAGSHCAKITPSHVERVFRSSARPVFSSIERSTQSQRMGSVESEKELRGSNKTRQCQKSWSEAKVRGQID
jgi:hypothetical protein